MNITLRAVDSEIACNRELLSYAKRSVQFALSRSLPVATTVTVRLSDLNGPRGGTDKCCKIELRVAGWHAFTEATHSDSRAAIDLACARMAGVVRKRQQLARGASRRSPVATRGKGVAA